MHRKMPGARRYPRRHHAERPNLSLVNEFGEPTRAWPDTFAPTSRIWADNWNVGAVYSPDGMTLQFDNSTIWQRDMGPPVRVRYWKAEVVR